MSAYETILFDTHEGVATLTLNQPEKRNPIGPTTLAELGDALERIAADDGIRVVVLAGAGKVFSAGGDLSILKGGGAKSELAPRSLPELLAAMHSLGKPIVAKVAGHALAGGLGLVVACDLVVAARGAQFGTTEIRVGLWPMMITAELVRNIGRKKTLELMLTGKKLSAEEARELGLINEVVDAEELDAAVGSLVAGLAKQSPTAMRLGLRSFYETQDLAFADALGDLEGRLTQILQTKDALEGISAFLQKREPQWSGR